MRSSRSRSARFPGAGGLPLVGRGVPGRGGPPLVRRDPQAQQLLLVVPLVERRVDVEPLVALETDQLRVEERREDLGDLGLADPRVALDEERLLHGAGQVHRRDDRAFRDVAVGAHGGPEVVDLAPHGPPRGGTGRWWRRPISLCIRPPDRPRSARATSVAAEVHGTALVGDGKAAIRPWGTVMPQTGSVACAGGSGSGGGGLRRGGRRRGRCRRSGRRGRRRGRWRRIRGRRPAAGGLAAGVVGRDWRGFLPRAHGDYLGEDAHGDLLGALGADVEPGGAAHARRLVRALRRAPPAPPLTWRMRFGDTTTPT